MVVNILIFFILLVLSAFFSGAETALLSINRVKIKELANQGDKRAQLVDTLLEDQTRLITTILIGNNLVNIGASAIATSISIYLFGNTGVGIATGIVTFLVLIFGEITPKSLGNKKSIKYSKFAAPIIYYMSKILTPVVSFFVFLIRLFIGRGNPLVSSNLFSEEEIRRYVNVSEEEGVIKESEKKMINSIFEFDDTTVKEIMVPRIDMDCIEYNVGLKKLIELVVEKGHSRIPVYQESIDNIIGVLYVKDLLNFIIEQDMEFQLSEFIRPAYFIPESKKINHLMTEMKRKKVHMAIVLDEYGGTSGLITIEDLLEEIVGDIQDEYDPDIKQIDIINERELLVDARVDIEELNEILPDPLQEEEGYETISGFILYHLGYLPKEGEKIELDNILLEIEESAKHRIEKVRIRTDKPVNGFDFEE